MYIYIHIPFCESKCPYCSFASFSDKFSLVRAYFDALKKDLQYQFEIFNPQKNKKIKTLYFGGGTPSSVDALFYEEIFEFLSPFFDKTIEICAEANPNSLNKKWLKQMVFFGLNRLSIGVQSFDDEKLKFLGRIHDKKMALNKIDLAAKFIKNINIDLIYATKFDDLKMLEKELKNIPDFINHISAYTLMLEEKTPFFNQFSYQNTDLKNINFFIDGLKNLGFNQYEISNFTKDKPSFHNLSYWQGKDYLGAGFGAVGFLQNKRFYHKNNLEFYIQNPCEKRIEYLNDDDLFLEKIFLGFRSNIGVDLSVLSDEKYKKTIEILQNENKICIKNGKIFNNDFLLADEIALFLINV